MRVTKSEEINIDVFVRLIYYYVFIYVHLFLGVRVPRAERRAEKRFLCVIEYVRTCT